ncbi:MAG: hypothetical protein WCP04_01125 [Pseudomonadota bacterium]|jgi:hypothetical protein
MREVARSVGSVALLLYMTAALPQSAVSALPNGELLEFLGGADAIAPELAQYLAGRGAQVRAPTTLPEQSLPPDKARQP